MTQDRRAPAPPSPRSTPRNRPPARRGARTARALLAGGGLLGGLAVVLAMTGGTEPPAPAAVATSLSPHPASRHPASAHRTAPRVVSPPDSRRFGADGPRARDAASADGAVRRVAQALQARVHPRAAPAHAVAAGSASPALPSHLLASAGFGPAEAFVPSHGPLVVAADVFVAPVPMADRRVRVAMALPAPPKRSAAAVPAAGRPPVEAALPDLPADASEPPRSARDALERELAAAAVPMPTARPARKAVAALAPARRERAPATLLAYARPDAGALRGDRTPAILGRPSPAAPPSVGAGTAIYDIAAATVYLPNGERLEAHSGLGRMRDDVRYVQQKNRGPTPPHVYDLTMRESLFHGVAAIRLNPVGGERNIHDRVGLLAHTYMLGPRGDSNGCVSFKDYKRFLAAFRRGEIRRLVVVPNSKRPTSRLASLFARK